MKGKLVIIALSLILFLFIGCENFPTSPNAKMGNIEIVTLTTPSGAVLQGNPLYVEELISAQGGGTLELVYQHGNSEMHHKVVFEPNALPNDTTVSMLIPHPNLVLLDFEPSGVNFSIPVQVELHYLGFNFTRYMGSNLDMFWWDETSGTWEPINADIEVSETELHVHFELEHFSRYALGRTD